MPLDEFKTQVLLMHSEQSTLDSLSSGFNDRYTVHCATSGSEALNTLVETPINVIVTAQDLPGMSGLEALREAKKRSPDTIGILLAGNEDEGLEALVGEEEVFKIVRDNVSSDSILKLVENATQQMRLMALAESANDTAAAPEEDGAQHIVMETSDNGSTIISDGTGRLPALNPSRFSASANLGARAVDLLVLTKDQEFLETIKESSRGLHKVYYANTLAQADEAIRKHSVGVAVVDAAMVGDKVEQLTLHLRKGVQRLVSIVAGRRDDGEMLMDMINRGKVYRFLMKPVSPGRARLAIEASVKYHLEAPDAAFGEKAVAAAKTPASKPTQKSTAAAAAKPAAQKAPEAKPKTAEQTKPAAVPAEAPKEKADNNDPPLGNFDAPEGESPLDSGLGDAFAEDDNSFTETVTGLISSVTSKFTGANDDNDGTGDKPEQSESLTPAASSIAPGTDGSAGDSGSPLQSPKVLGLAAAAVVVVAGALFWLMSGSETPEAPEQTAATPSISESDVSFAEEAPVDAVSVDADDLIDEARLAQGAGQIFNPVGSNAIELYAAAIAAEPDNSTAIAEFDAVVGEALSMAETAMLEARLDDADAAIARVTQADPDNSRLPFLAAQISQMQVSRYLTDARGAIRENRFEDAAAAIASARGLAPASSSEINAVSDELQTARSDQQVDDVLAKAIEKLDSGDLLSPANDNARYYYDLVLSNDPTNSAARQGLTIIASRVAGQAQTAVARGEFSAADDLIDDARAIDANNGDVAAASAALSRARSDAAERRRQAEVDRVAAEEAAEAERLAQETAQQEAADQEAARLAAASTTPASQPEAAAEAPESLDASAKDVGISDGVAGKVAQTDDAETTAAGSDNTTNSGPDIAAISSLNRTKYVAPKYPRAAQRRNVSGWVDVVFTVAADGSVKDATVRESNPGETFNNAALTAVEKWKFEPVIESGRRVEKRAGVRMMFALEN